MLTVDGDGRLGYPDDAPYDAIHVGAAAATIPQPVSIFYLSIACKCLVLSMACKHLLFEYGL